MFPNQNGVEAGKVPDWVRGGFSDQPLSFRVGLSLWAL